MKGHGKYTFPTETTHRGIMDDGKFHGPGTLLFTDGGKYKATWDNGIAVKVGI